MVNPKVCADRHHKIECFPPRHDPRGAKGPRSLPILREPRAVPGRLPSAFFTCGTDDALLDDSVSMATKWMITGGDAIIKIYPGACHGFTMFSRDLSPEAGKALDDAKTYIQQRMATV